MRLIGKAMARCRLLFHHGRILLRTLIHGVYCLVDLAQGNRLLARSVNDCHDVTVDILDVCGDLLKRAACLAHQGHAVGDLSARRGNECLDFLCGSCRALSQFANFLCDNSETFAGFAGACRFHASVQRKKIRLESDFVDDADDIGDLPR